MSEPLDVSVSIHELVLDPALAHRRRAIVAALHDHIARRVSALPDAALAAGDLDLPGATVRVSAQVSADRIADRVAESLRSGLEGPR